jgi:3-methyl-2-oxobutanoate hydroxymethyltransferase
VEHGSNTTMSNATVTLSSLREMKSAGRKIACLTCYDATFARVLEAAGVDLLLVGDSLGNVLQGHDSTIPVTLEDMVYHAASVARARRRALLMVDMPFLSYRTPALALDSAARLMQQGGAQMVKLEGGAAQLETVRCLTAQGVPVCGHLGLQPQSVFALGGYRVQGRDVAQAQAIQRDAAALQEAGAALLVLECVPSPLAADISRRLRIPVIGIGAGAGCDGQVLVLHDILGIQPPEGKPPRFVKDFLAGSEGIDQAVRAYVQAVRDGSFPAAEHGFG